MTPETRVPLSEAWELYREYLAYARPQFLAELFQEFRQWIRRWLRHFRRPARKRRPRRAVLLAHAA